MCLISISICEHAIRTIFGSLYRLFQGNYTPKIDRLKAYMKWASDISIDFDGSRDQSNRIESTRMKCIELIN